MADRVRRVLVTGGASGIGAAVASAFLAHGDHVTVLDRRPADDPSVVSVVGDVRSPGDHERAVAQASAAEGLDVLVANAGVHDGGLGLLDVDGAELAARFREVLEINVLGGLLAARAAAAALTQARGVVVMTLSDASYDVIGNNAGVLYATAKHGALGLLRVLARELAPHVRVNGVAPGGVRTGLARVESGGRSSPVFSDPERLARSVAERTLLGRGADLEGLAATYLYLSSPAAAGITGQVMRVDGGLLS
jgi:2,3-dihydroxy-2,3-dihydrophenylpropionate dehydrogenase